MQAPKLKMKVGDLVKDNSTGDVVMIVGLKPTYTDHLGDYAVWDFAVICDGNVYNLDIDEIEELKND